VDLLLAELGSSHGVLSFTVHGLGDREAGLWDYGEAELCEDPGGHLTREYRQKIISFGGEEASNLGEMGR